MITKKIYVALTSLTITLLLGACASVPMTDLEQDREAKQFKVNPDKSRIYIYRNETLGSAIKVAVTVDGKLVGQTAPHTYFSLNVEPGKHEIGCFAESNSQVSVHVKNGEAAYIFQEMKMGFMSAGCSVQQVSATEGQQAIQSCKRAQANF